MDGREPEGETAYILLVVTQGVTTVLPSLDPAFGEAKESANTVKSPRGTEGLGNSQAGQLDRTQESCPISGEAT